MRKLLWRIGFEIHWPWIATKLLLNEISLRMKRKKSRTRGML
jgi:hypothetical protein